METESVKKSYEKNMLKDIMRKIGELNHLKDIDAILDKVLKKPGELDDEEYDRMK